MFGFGKDRSGDSNARYASRADYCRIFQEDMGSLYLLSFLLTANHAGAEQCYVEGIENAVKGFPVFKEWARSWSRRSVIQSAIRLVFAESVQGTVQDVWHKSQLESPVSAIDSVVRLPRLDRCVFVMSVLERYTDCDCSLLLKCKVQDVRDARSRALQSLAGVEPELQIPRSRHEWSGKLPDGECA